MGGVVLAAVAALGVGALVAGCSSGPGTLTVHGTDEVDYSTQGASDPYSDGTQVVIYNSDNDVIATGTLSTAPQQPNPLNGEFGLEADYYTFTVTVPAGLSRYGIEIGGQHGIVWESEKQMKSGPGLDLDLTSGTGLGF
jgi:hypothetical protein